MHGGCEQLGLGGLPIFQDLRGACSYKKIWEAIAREVGYPSLPYRGGYFGKGERIEC